ASFPSWVLCYVSGGRSFSLLSASSCSSSDRDPSDSGAPGEQQMISRQWRGLARREEAAAYQAHLQAETFPAIRQIEGFIDAAILKRAVANGVEFLVVTHWESLAAIARFA